MIKVVYNQEEPPKFFKKSLYLAGTNIKEAENPNTNEEKIYTWRDQVIAQIEKDFPDDWCIFVPEDNPSGGPKYPNPNDKEALGKQVDWETTWMNAADAVIFWLPRNASCLGLTSNVEFGRYYRSGKVFVGSPYDPTDQDKNSYLKCLSEWQGMEWFYNLEDLVKAAVKYIGKGAIREGPERKVPIKIWEHRAFKNWKKDMESNSLDCEITDYLTLFTDEEPDGPGKRDLFLWIVRPIIKVGKENRVKDSDFVIGRKEGVSICIYTNDTELDDTKVVLVKEFRPAGREKDGYVLEFPSGAVHDSESDKESSFDELEEETGIAFKDKIANKIKLVGSRQAVPTLLANSEKVYKLGVSSEEMKNIESSVKGKSFGLEEDTEITYVEIKTWKEILAEKKVDWKTLGILTQCLLG